MPIGPLKKKKSGGSGGMLARLAGKIAGEKPPATGDIGTTGRAGKRGGGDPGYQSRKRKRYLEGDPGQEMGPRHRVKEDWGKAKARRRKKPNNPNRKSKTYGASYD